MKRDHRRSASKEVMEQVWDRWGEGLGIAEISRVLRVRSIRVRSIIDAGGGIRPASRCRSRRVLSMAECEEISRGLKAECSVREIARHLKRAPSSISREIVRHGGRRCYRDLNADQRAWRRARRPKQCLLSCNEVSRVALSRVINGRAALSAELAIRLAAMLGGSAESWLRMQVSFDLWQAEKKRRPKIEPLRKVA